MIRSLRPFPLSFFLILFLLLVPVGSSRLVYAQIEKNIPRSQSSTMEGRHFYLGFMRNEIDENRNIDKNGNDGFMNLMIFVGATEQTQVTIRYTWETTGTVYTIAGDSVLTLDVPPDKFTYLEMRESEKPSYGMVEVTTDKKTIVYALNSSRLSSDAYSALPVSNWGKEYVVVSVPNDSYAPPGLLSDSIPRACEFMIMASEDSTLVQFSPKAETAKGNKAGQLQSIYLMKGQCYLVQSTQKLERGLGDQTGTIIRSDKPIGVLSGHVRTSIPVQYGEPLSYTKRDSKDHIVDMLFPTKIWGSYYISTPFNIYSAGDLIRVVSIQPNTKVTAIGNNVFRDFVLTNPGDVEDFYPVGVPVVWIADKPIQIAQFMPTSLQDAVQTFDPCMVIVPPTEQFVSRILFEIPSLAINANEQYFENYVNIVCERAAVPSITLDGTNLLSKYPRLIDQQIPNTQYNWLVVPVKPGVHDFRADIGRFSGIVYGTAPEDSYALSLGLSLLKTTFVDSTPPSFAFQSNCDKITVQATEAAGANAIGLDEVSILKDSTYNYTWEIDSVYENTMSLTVAAEPIDITKNGRIVIIARDKLGNGRQLTYVYNALSLEVRDNIVFKAVNWKDSTCEKVVVKNNGTDTILFLGSAITGDKRVNFDGIIPLVNQRLAPKDSVSFIVCFKPQNDSSSLNAKLMLSLTCGRQITIPLTGDVAAPSLLLKGWDFGKVLIGDTACSTVYVINNGNTDVNLQKISLSPIEPSFRYDTTGLFPRFLKSGDTLAIPVCFTPLARRVYGQFGTVPNSLNIPNGIPIVTGEGVAPLVENVQIDWRQRRQGTINDSVVSLVNKGNYQAYLQYSTMSGDTGAISSLVTFMLPALLQPNDTVHIPVRFIPDSVKLFSARIVAAVRNWKLHPPVDISLTGEGILPTVRTIDVDFDTITIRTFKDTSALVLLTGGNDRLTIDTMIWVNGNADAFEIDAANFSARTLAVGSTITMPIRFTGMTTTTGLHQATIAVIHDALPAYKRDTSFIRLTGVVVNKDSTQYSLQLSSPAALYACAPEKLVISIKNTGNTPLNFQKITPSPVIGTLLLPLNVPPAQSIAPDSVLQAVYSVEMQQGGQASTITFTVQCNDTIISTTKTTLTPRANPLTFDPIADTSQLPGKTLTLRLSGSVRVPVAMPLSPQMTLLLNYQILDVLNSKGMLYLRDSLSGGIDSIPVHIAQEPARVVIKTDTPWMLRPGVTTWSIAIPFAVMLSQFDDCTINATLADTVHPCFSVGTGNVTVHIGEVCANALRKVAEAGIQFNLIRITPSPITDVGTAEITLQGDGLIRVDAINELGERMLIAEENLRSGRYELRFSTKNFASGVYGLIVRAADGRERRATFVIQR